MIAKKWRRSYTEQEKWETWLRWGDGSGEGIEEMMVEDIGEDINRYDEYDADKDKFCVS